MMPASTMKVVTLAAAAEKLGWDYTLRRRALFAAGTDRRRRSSTAISSSSAPAIRASTTGTARRRSCSPTGPRSSRAAGISRSTAGSSATTTRSTTTASGSGWAWDDLASELRGQRQRAAVQRGLGAAETRAGRDRRREGRRSTCRAGLQRPHARQPASRPAPPVRSPAIARRRLPGTPAPRAARRRCRSRTRPFSETASVDNPTLYFVTALRRALVADGIDVQGPAVDIDDLDAPPARDAADAARHVPVAAAVDAGDDDDEAEPEPVRGDAAEDARRRQQRSGRRRRRAAPAVRSVLRELEHRRRRA